MKWRSWWIWPALGVTLIATFVDYPPKEEQGAAAQAVKGGEAKPPSVPMPPAPQSAEATRIEIERLQQQKTEGSKAISNAFNPTSWYVAKPAPPPPPPPPPTAPPLPFAYLGRYEDPPKLLVILAKGDRVYTVSEGEVIEGTYRVDRVGDETVEFVYLPLNANQSLATHSASQGKPVQPGIADRYRRP